MKKILFSAVGSTDPIAGQHDGAILHIARNFELDEIWLFLSKEMYELDQKDNRYIYCLERLRESTGKNYEVKKVVRDELVDVHIFDSFLTEFKEIIQNIYEENHEDCEVLLNVSSGTPAMKSALQVLATMSEKKMLPIQVATPSKAYNEHRENVKGDYEVELQWEMNLDNEKDSQNRCSISSNKNLAAEMKKDIIRSLINAYDYVGAYEIAKNMTDFIRDDAIALLRASASRLKLDKEQCDRYLKNVNYEMFPHKSKYECSIFEYLLLQEIKLRKEEYTDFIRSISPLFFSLLERVIEKQLGVSLENYYKIEIGLNGTERKVWSKWKVAEDETLTRILTNNGRQELTSKVIFTAHLVTYIKLKSKDASLIKLIDEIRQVEEELRNPVAHCITYVTEKVIKEATGLTAKGIFNKLKQLANYAGLRISEEDMQSYDLCNQEILRLL